MQSFTVGEFKQKLPEILEQVSKGKSVILQKGRRRENVAILTPYSEKKSAPRKLGVFAKRGIPKFKDWELAPDDFLEG